MPVKKKKKSSVSRAKRSKKKSGLGSMTFASTVAAIIFLFIVVRPMIFGSSSPSGKAPAKSEAVQKNVTPPPAQKGADKKGMPVPPQPGKPPADVEETEVLPDGTDTLEDTVWCCSVSGKPCVQKTLDTCEGGFMNDQKKCDIACIVQ